MIDVYVREILLTVLCILEAGMCFKLACLVLKGERILTKMQRTGIVIGSLLIGLGLAYNRNLLFFSDKMWIFVMTVMGIWACLVIKRRLMLVVELVVLYMTAVSLLDFFFAFLCMSYLQDQFWTTVYYRAMSWWALLIYLCTRAVVFAVIIFIDKCLNAGWEMIRFRKILLPVCIVLCVLVRFFRILLVIIADGVLEMQGWTVGVSLLACLILMLFLVIFLQKSNALQDENEILRIRDDLQKQRYLDLENQHGESRRIIHDIKNHIMVLQSMCTNQDLEGISNYLQDINEEFQKPVSCHWSDNDILNIVLNQKMQEAQKAEIEMRIQCSGYVRMPFHENEIVSLFGNLLDNALEACQNVLSCEKFIEVRLDQKRDMIYLKIVNSVEEEPVIKNNCIASTKKDGKSHGYGLKNVRRIVEKYNGVMVMETSDHRFSIFISFFITTGEEDV